MMRIGELAKRTGVSVRTLHHYDAIGLLVPSHRSESGHRLYGRDEMIRLQQILSLRQMGLPLEEIASLLGGPATTAPRILAMHIDRLRRQITAQQELCTRLEALASRFTAAEGPSVDELIETMETITMYEEMYGKYFTPEQLETLRQRREQLGDAHLREVEQEWPRLIAEVQELKSKGTDPKDPRMQQLAKRWMELIAEFTGGDPAIAQSVANLYRGEPKFEAQMGLDGSLFAYVKQALQ
ncbi:MAG TPA: MerR family transcriptional regulator [Thermoanaerobaculia bacterium]|nr:MerR family transcriptional regulator [Thermoanaerobaculia bacterium]